MDRIKRLALFQQRPFLKTIYDYAILTAATLLLVAGVYFFKFPNNFSFGGVTGISVVLAALFPVSPATVNFIINMSLV